MIFMMYLHYALSAAVTEGGYFKMDLHAFS
jgi:hypothetical protein